MAFMMVSKMRAMSEEVVNASIKKKVLVHLLADLFISDRMHMKITYLDNGTKIEREKMQTYCIEHRYQL